MYKVCDMDWAWRYYPRYPLLFCILPIYIILEEIAKNVPFDAYEPRLWEVLESRYDKIPNGMDPEFALDIGVVTDIFADITDEFDKRYALVVGENDYAFYDWLDTSSMILLKVVIVDHEDPELCQDLPF